jgi:ABC-type phosphate/phosphonate transport system substrate-binding protein
MRIGVVRTLAPGMPTGLLALAMRPFREYMEEKTGASGEVVRGGDAFDLAKQLRDGKLQVGIFHGHEFAWARQKYAALEPIVVCVNPLRLMRAILVVPAASPAASYADLEGKTLALPKDSRDHCRLFFECRCVKPGVEPAKFYQRLLRPGDTEDTLDDLAAGRMQAAVVDAAALERYKKANPGRARQLRPLAESEPFPPGVIAYYGGKLAEADVKKVREALVAAKGNPRGKRTLALLKLSHFEEAPPDYEAALKAIAKAYPPPAPK